jgi:hypothetical protein
MACSELCHAIKQYSLGESPITHIAARMTLQAAWLTHTGIEKQLSEEVVNDIRIYQEFKTNLGSVYISG